MICTTLKLKKEVQQIPVISADSILTIETGNVFANLITFGLSDSSPTNAI